MKTRFLKSVRFLSVLGKATKTGFVAGWSLAAFLACTSPVQAASTLQFSATTYTVSEGAGTASLTVQRTNDVDTLVSVDYATIDGTATNGLKYTAVSGTLQFAAGETNQPIVVPILNEPFVEGTKNFRVLLTNASEGAVLGTRATATVNITDNDSGLRFFSSAYTVSEEAGFVEIGVVRGDDGNYPVTVDFTTTNVTAMAGTDYEGVTNSLTFAAGEKLKLVRITILNDAVRESSKTFRVRLGNPTGGGQLGSPTLATVTVTDTDEVVQLEFDTYYAGEETGFVRIGVLRGENNTNATVDFQTTNVSATAGLDYGGLTNTLTFAPGERLKLVDIPILNDGLKEGNETFRVILSNPTGGAALGTPQSATVTIRDNDPGVQFTQNQLWVQEQEGSVLLTMTRGNDQLLDAFTVDYATTNGTAKAGSDYAETKGTLTFAAGEMTQSFAVPILDDGVKEADEQFKVVLRNPTGGMVLGVASNVTATVTVCDTMEMRPHRFESVRVSPDGTVSLTLGGGFTPGVGLSNRFLPYLDLYPLEVSSDLKSWSPLTWLVRTNTSTNVLVYTDAGGGQSQQRFYRVPSRTFITPTQPPTGPFAVGRIDRWLTDPTRRNRFLISTNSSFQVAIWYPAIPRAGSWPLVWADEPVLRDPAWGDWLDRERYFVSYAAGNLDLASSLISYPVVLVTPGWNGVRQDLWEKADELASHGYIVVAPDHFDAWGVVLPDGTYSSGADGKDMTVAGLQDRVRDLGFIVDQLERWNLSDPFFAGRLDLGRIAVLGHSWGGPTAAEFCRIDARCRAVVALDPGGFDTTPVLTQVGLLKPVLTVNRADNTDTTLYAKTVADAVWFQMSKAEHWDIAGYGYNPYGTIVHAELAREANWTINAYVIWFLNKYLNGSTDPMPALADYPRIFNFKQK